MSFEQSIDGQAVEFFSELDYLYCKSEYFELKESKDSGVSCLTFLEFLQFELYDHDRCVVVKISDPPSIFTIPATNYLTFTANDSAIYANDTNAITFGDGPTGIGVPGIPIGSQTVYEGNFEFAENQYQLVVDNDGVEEQQVEEQQVEEKKEEPPEDPIEERWDILDL